MSQEPSPKPEPEKEEHAREDIATLEILGAFLSVFGGALIVAIFFTGGERAAVEVAGIALTTAQLTNLVCGLLILGIGAGMFLRGRAVRRKRT